MNLKEKAQSFNENNGKGVIAVALSQQDEKLWDLMNDEYKNIVNEFALAVFGIGALFFAVGQVETPTLKQLIDLISFGASLTMWIHMHDASKQIRAVREELRNSNPKFMMRNTLINSWRHTGVNRILYQPITRLMTYFMGLVALAWLELVVNGLGRGFAIGVPLPVRPTLLAIGSDALLFAFILALVRRARDITRSLVRTPANTVTLAKEAKRSSTASLVTLAFGLLQLVGAFSLAAFDFPSQTAPYALVLFIVGSLFTMGSLLLEEESQRLLKVIGRH
jgi:hypothetical protein